LDSVSKSHDHATIQQALETMNSAIPLVTRPYTTTEFKQRGPSRSALSLGPFGAQLVPAQEYTGLYPGPFGRYSPSQIAYSPESASVVCPPVIPATDDTCEDALVGFHLGRLQDMAKSESFDLLSMYAFETVPSLTEARAIRRAVAMFEGNRREDQKRPWYISFVFPVNAGSGEPALPDVECKGSMMDEVVKATFGLSNTTSRYSRPDGIGINCTGPDHLPFLLSRLSTSLAQLSPPTLPWLVLYPDGGSVYDVITRSWSGVAGTNDLEWARKLSDCVESALPLYGGIIAGGCCKAGMKAIRHLRVELEQRGLIL
jgi:homocysteine S-methyltransferase